MPDIAQLATTDTGKPRLALEPLTGAFAIRLTERTPRKAGEISRQDIRAFAPATAKTPVPGLDKFNPAIKGFIQGVTPTIETEGNGKAKLLKLTHAQFFAQAAGAFFKKPL